MKNEIENTVANLKSNGFDVYGPHANGYTIVRDTLFSFVGCEFYRIVCTESDLNTLLTENTNRPFVLTEMKQSAINHKLHELKTCGFGATPIDDGIRSNAYIHAYEISLPFTGQTEYETFVLSAKDVYETDTDATIGEICENLIERFDLFSYAPIDETETDLDGITKEEIAMREIREREIAKEIEINTNRASMRRNHVESLMDAIHIFDKARVQCAGKSEFGWKMMNKLGKKFNDELTEFVSDNDN